MAKAKQRELKKIRPLAAEHAKTMQLLNGAEARARHIIATAKANWQFAGKLVVEVRQANAFLRSHTKNTSTADQAREFLNAVSKIRITRRQ
ncbi:MAG: hypothetical protein QGI60_01140 [archaeon]|jgi:hypothetical protein|nr:hypothetical protein [archaeon]